MVFRFVFYYLFGIGMICDEAVTLADNGGVAASSNSVHFPVCVVVVNNMDVTKSGSRHSLYQSLSEMVERYRHLHFRVQCEAVGCAEKHHLQHTLLKVMKHDMNEKYEKA